MIGRWKNTETLPTIWILPYKVRISAPGWPQSAMKNLNCLELPKVPLWPAGVQSDSWTFPCRRCFSFFWSVQPLSNSSGTFTHLHRLWNVNMRNGLRLFAFESGNCKNHAPKGLGCDSPHSQTEMSTQSKEKRAPPVNSLTLLRKSC